MADQKRSSGNLYPQTNIRFTDIDRERIQFIASELHKAGLPGFLDRQFRPVTTEVIRYLIEDKARQLKQVQGQKMDQAVAIEQAKATMNVLISAMRDHNLDSTLLTVAENALASIKQVKDEYETQLRHSENDEFTENDQ